MHTYQIKISGLYMYGCYKSHKFNAITHPNPEIKLLFEYLFHCLHAQIHPYKSLCLHC